MIHDRLRKRNTLYPLPEAFYQGYAACISEGSTDPARLRALPEAARLRIIPAATATGHSLLIGIRPDRVTIRLPDAEGATEAIALIAPLELPEAGEAGNPALQALIPAALI